MEQNRRLREAMSGARVTPIDLASKLGVDPKTIQRWISGRIPYPRHRADVAKLLGEDEAFLWPETASGPGAAGSEIIRTYPYRSAVPMELWQRLFRNAENRIRVLAFSGLFLPETDPNLIDHLRQKAKDGVKIEILMGDPDCEAVRVRGLDEGIGEAMSAKIRNVLAFYKPLVGEPGISIGLHPTTLYNSVYQYDDEMLVNTHLYGAPAAHAPVHHLRWLSSGSLFTSYTKSVDRASEASKPLESK